MLQQFIGQSSSSLNNSINTAVILAAGRGERIAGDEKYRSKPLMKLYDLSLIERSIKKLSNKLKVLLINIIDIYASTIYRTIKLIFKQQY